MAKIISIAEAKKNLLKLSRRNQELGESFVFVKDSVPVSALIPFDEYESLLETLNILEEDPAVGKRLKAAENQIKRGEYSLWRSQKVKKRA